MADIPVRYYLSSHAAKRGMLRFTPLEITLSDVLAVIARPIKATPGEDGCTNAYGYSANGIRIRVTYDAVTGAIVTLSIADSRYQ
jgi:hypothetical protein